MYQYMPSIRTKIHTKIHTNTERWYWYVSVRIKFQYVHYTSLMFERSRRSGTGAIASFFPPPEPAAAGRGRAMSMKPPEPTLCHIRLSVRHTVSAEHPSSALVAAHTAWTWRAGA